MFRIAILILASVATVGRCDDLNKREIISEISTKQAEAIKKIKSLALLVVEKTRADSPIETWKLYWHENGQRLVERAEGILEPEANVIDRLSLEMFFGGDVRGRFVHESLQSYLSRDPRMFDSRVQVATDSSESGDFRVTVRYSAQGLDDIFVTSYYSRKNSFLPTRIVQSRGNTLEESQVLLEELFAYSTVGDLILPKLVIRKRLENPQEERRFVVTRIHSNFINDSDRIETLDDLNPELWR